MNDVLRKEVFIKSKETLSYRYRQGGKKTLLLIHGNMSSSRHFDLLMENMHDEYTVYAIDLRGFGNSSYLNQVESIKAFSDDIKYFADAIGIHEFSLLGWSLGGNVAMRFTLDYPNMVEKLVLLSSGSVAGFPVRKKKCLGLIKTQRYITSKNTMAEQVKPIEKMKRKENYYLLKSLMKHAIYNKHKPPKERFNYYLREMLMQRNLVDVNIALAYFNISSKHNGVVEGSKEAKNITVPTLIIHGDKDRVVPVAKAKENKAAIGENADLHIIRNGDHALMVGTLTQTLKLIETFV